MAKCGSLDGIATITMVVVAARFATKDDLAIFLRLSIDSRLVYCMVCNWNGALTEQTTWWLAQSRSISA